MMYLYPKNLKSKLVMWFWSIKDIILITILSIIGVYQLSTSQSTMGIFIATIYAILTMRFEDVSILSFLKYAIIFFFSQQEYKWRE